MKLRLLAGLIPAVLTPLILTSCPSGDPLGTNPPSGPPWTSVQSGTTFPLNAVWGSSASDVWTLGGAGGLAAILHYNGTSWGPSWASPSSATWYMFGIWGVSGSDVGAVG